MGREAYRRLCRAVSVRFQRGKGRFETYNYLTIVLDPTRDVDVCVLPSPAVCGGLDVQRVSDD